MGGRGRPKRQPVGRAGAGARHGQARRPTDRRGRRGQRGGTRALGRRRARGRGGAVCHVLSRGGGQHFCRERRERRGWSRPGGNRCSAKKEISDSLQRRGVQPPGAEGVNPRGQSGLRDNRGPPTDTQAAVRQGQGSASEKGVYFGGGVSGVR